MQNFKLKFFIVFLIKQFFFINLFEELKKLNFLVRKKLGVLLNRRLYIVDIVFLLRGVILVNGYYNLLNFIGLDKVFNRQCDG